MLAAPLLALPPPIMLVPGCCPSCLLPSVAVPFVGGSASLGTQRAPGVVMVVVVMGN